MTIGLYDGEKSCVHVPGYRDLVTADGDPHALEREGLFRLDAPTSNRRLRYP